MMKTEIVRSRVEVELKDQASEIFDSIGLTMSQSIRLFLQKVATDKSFPFSINVPNAKTMETIEATDRGEGLRRYESADAMWKDLNV